MKLTLVAASIALTLVFAPLAFAQDCVVRPRLVSVTGTAEVNVAPDEVALSLGIDSQDKDLSAAKAQHDRRMKELLADAQAAGVDQKDIQTSTLEMRPQYSGGKVPKFLYYEVSQTIQLTLKDLSKYEALVTKLVVADVTRINSVDFRVAETRKFRDEARQKAVQAAKEKATAMAAELGQTIGKPWEIAEDIPDVFSTQYMANSVSNRQRLAQEESTVAPGQVTISATVHVSFQLD